MKKITDLITTNSFIKIFCLSWLLLIPFIFCKNDVLAQSTTARAPGTPSGSYHLSDFDTVNLFTGNLNFNLPLVSIGGRGEAGTNLGIVSETQWDYKDRIIPESERPGGFIEQTYTGNSPYPLAFVGHLYLDITQTTTGTCGGNSSTQSEYRYNLIYTEPNGTQHNLRDLSNIHGYPYTTCGGGTYNLGNKFESSANDFVTFVADTNIWLTCYNVPNCTDRPDGYLYFRDGTKARVVAGDGFAGNIGYVQWIQDRNGNKTQYDYESNPHVTGGKRLTKITDSVGREIDITLEAVEPAPYGNCTKITYNGFGGGEQNKKIVRISYSNPGEDILRHTRPSDNYSGAIIYDDPNDNILINFGGGDLAASGGSEGGPNGQQIKAVWLPDGRSYKFKYNVLGQIARVELPTGGATEYDFADISQLPFNPPLGATGYPSNRVSEKRIYNTDGSLVNKTVFSIPTSYTSGVFPQGRPGIVRDIDQFDSSGNRLSKSRHYFYGLPSGEFVNFTAWWHAREFRTETFDANGTTMLRISENNWQPNIPSWCSTLPNCNSNPTEYAPTYNPFIAETKETIVDGNLVTKTSGINPVNGSLAFDIYNNQTDTWQYDYGIGQPGSLLKHTHISFANYDSPGSVKLLGLVTATNVYAVDSSSGQETLASASQTTYDEYSQYPLLTYGTVTGWQDPGNIRGNPTTVKQWLNTNNSWIQTHAQFDQLGNSRKSWDALGRMSETLYNDAFTDSINRNTYAFPTQSISPNPSSDNGVHGITNSFVSTSVYDYWSGLPKSSTDINGQTTNFEYNDPLNRLKKIISPNGAWTSYEYGDTISNLYVRTQATFDATRTLDSYSFFDGLGRKVRSAKLDGEGTWVTSDTQYDAAGRVWRTSNPYHASGLYGAVNPSGIWTTNEYDALSRTTQVTAADGSVSLTSYFGNTVTGQDPAGKKRKTASDALNRLTQVIEDPNGLNVTTNYKYDILGNLRAVEQDSQRRYYMYDSLSRLIYSRNPEQDFNSALVSSDPVTSNSQWSNAFEYLSNGSMAAKIDARGIRVEYSYDNLNRLYRRHYITTQTLQAGIYTTTPDDEYFYDGTGLSITPNFALGKMTKIYSTLSETRYTQFDSMGRVLASEQITDGQTYQMNYNYNLSGTLVSQIYPSHKEVKNFFDNGGDLSQVSGRTPTTSYKMYAGSIDYDFTNTGATSLVQLGNGRWESMTFNKRLQPLQVALGTAQNGTDLLKLNYSYGINNDNNGNIKSQTITVPTVGQNTGFTAVQIYGYDEMNRILTATETSNGSQSWQQTFTYDRFGNRQINANTNATTPSLIGDNPNIGIGKNRIDPRAGEYYQYDAAGNLTTDKGGNSFSYDGDNHQTTFTPIGILQPTATYVYDSEGKRVKKTSGSETTIFVYNALGQMIAEYGINNQVPQLPTTSYLTNDNLGTPRINTDSNGVVQARHDYLPFGGEIQGLGGRTTSTGYQMDMIRQKFTGYQRDVESGLDYAQARYYASSGGRFTSVDPLMASANAINPQSFNRYSYSMNNPYRYIDPSGMDPSGLDEETEMAFAQLGGLIDGAAARTQAIADAARAAAARRQSQQNHENLHAQQTSQQNSQQGNAPQQPTPIATESGSLENDPNEVLCLPGQIPTTVIVEQLTVPRRGVVPINGVQSLVVGVILRFTILDADGIPIAGAEVTESVKALAGDPVIQNPKTGILGRTGSGDDIVSNVGGARPEKNSPEEAAMTVGFNKPFTTRQLFTLTIKTPSGVTATVTQERTLTNQLPGAPQIAGGVRGYTFSMEAPKIRLGH